MTDELVHGPSQYPQWYEGKLGRFKFEVSKNYLSWINYKEVTLLMSDSELDALVETRRLARLHFGLVTETEDRDD